MKRNQIILVLLGFILFNSCSSEYNVEGIWESKENQYIKYVILDNKSKISLRQKNLRNWIDLGKLGANEYILDANTKIQFTSEGVFELKRNSGKVFTYTKIKGVLPEDKWAVNKGMRRESVKTIFTEPDTVINENHAEKWIFGNLALIFDDQAIFKVNSNYQLKKDFSSVRQGMTKKEVLDILGEPDRRSKQAYNPPHQIWYYGKGSIIFGDKVAKVIPNNAENVKNLEKTIGNNPKVEVNVE